MGPVDSPASASTQNTPGFEFKFFTPEIINETFPPVLMKAMSSELDLDMVEGYLGSDLFDTIFNEGELKPEANEYIPSPM